MDLEDFGIIERVSLKSEEAGRISRGLGELERNKLIQSYSHALAHGCLKFLLRTAAYY